MAAKMNSTNEKRDDVRVMEAFDSEARTYMEQNYFSSQAHSFLVRRERVYELLDRESTRRVLDVGCGPGVIVDEVLRRGGELYGVDLSKEMIDVCKKKFGSKAGAHFSVGSVEALEFADGFFDVVIGMGLLEYLEHPQPAVQEMARVTAPGGILVVTLPNRASPYRIWNRTVYWKLRDAVKRGLGATPDAGLNHREFRPGEIASVLELCGMTVEDVMYYNFEVFLPPLNRLFPRAALSICQSLEKHYRGRLGTLGTGFIIKARKR